MPPGPMGPGQVPPGRVPPGARPGVRPGTGGPAVTQGQRPPGKVRVVRDTRNRRLVRRVDVWSVFKVSVTFYVCILVVLLVAGTVLWNVASAFGVIKTIDKLVRSLFALTSFQIHPLAALAWGAAVGAVLCMLGVLVNVIAAVLYNLISDVIGGVQVVIVSDKDA